MTTMQEEQKWALEKPQKEGESRRKEGLGGLGIVREDLGILLPELARGWQIVANSLGHQLAWNNRRIDTRVT